MVAYLQRRHYRPMGRPLRACHPRDLLDQVTALCRYRGTSRTSRASCSTPPARVLPQGRRGTVADGDPLNVRHSHAAVLDEVRRALRQREGLIVVTGATGTGTTSLCRTLVQELEPGACASIVLDPRVTLDDLLLHALTDFGVISSGQQIALNGAPTRDQLVRALQHFLASLIPMWGCAVLVIDEAQDVDPEVLRQLRLLLNFETDGAKLLQIVLVGQPELNHVLRHPSLRQLDDCVARRCELEPPPLAEPVRYAEEFVSGPQPLERVPQVTVLEPDDIDRDLAGPVLTYLPPVSVVATRPRIVPQTIEVVCDRALDVVHERRLRRVDWRITRTVGSHPLLRALAPSRLRSSNKALAAAAVVLVGVVGLGVGSWSAGGAGLPARCHHRSSRTRIRSSYCRNRST